MSGEIERGFVQKIFNGDWALKMCGVTALKEDAEEQHPCRICKDGTLRKIDERKIFAMVQNFLVFSSIINEYVHLAAHSVSEMGRATILA